MFCVSLLLLTLSHTSCFSSTISAGNVVNWLVLKSSLHSHIQPYQLLQFTDLIRQCSQLVSTQVQSPFSHSAIPAPSVQHSHQAMSSTGYHSITVSILTSSHSSSFSSTISAGNVVNWLVLKSSLHSHIQLFQLLQFNNLDRQCSQLVSTQVQSPFSHSAIPAPSVHRSHQAMQSTG